MLQDGPALASDVATVNQIQRIARPAQTATSELEMGYRMCCISMSVAGNLWNSCSAVWVGDYGTAPSILHLNIILALNDRGRVSRQPGPLDHTQQS